MTIRPTASATPQRRLLRRCAHGAGALLALAVGGLVLDAGAGHVREAELTDGLRRPLPAIDRSDALSQNLAIFTLGGLRSLAAEIYSLDALSAWQDRDWERLERRWDMVTTLAPHRVNYWISAAWDMGRNAESGVRNNERLSVEERATMARLYRQRGIRFLEDAIANNPDQPLLYCTLGEFLSDTYRHPRFAEAAEAYHRAVELGAPKRYRRMEFFCLARVRGREKEAYALGRELFEDESQRVPSLQNLLFVLQNRLDLPENERLGVEEIYGSEENARSSMEMYVDNNLRYPVDGIREYLSAHPGRKH